MLSDTNETAILFCCLYPHFVNAHAHTQHTTHAHTTPHMHTHHTNIHVHAHTTHTHTNNINSGVFFMYDLSPMMVQLTEHKKSLAHFLTGVCAIIGGVFTVAGMVDGMLYHSTRALKKKVELGKAS